MDTKKLLEIMKAISEKIEAEKDVLTELDSAIGDGDHGINMARGAKTVMEKLPSLIGKDSGAIFKGIGMAIVSSVGGASGAQGKDGSFRRRLSRSIFRLHRGHKDARQIDYRGKDYARCPLPCRTCHA